MGFATTRAEAMKEEKRLRALIPNTGFIGKYMSYTDKQESPGSFHFWVGVSTLASVVQRRVFVSKGVYDVFPNLYVVLVAPSGRCRKSRAIAMGLDLISGEDWANVLADKTTPEAVLQALQYGTSGMEKMQDGGKGVEFNLDACGVIRAEELSVFLNKQQYNSGMISLLTHMYDCPHTFKYLTRNKRPIVLNDICLNLLGGITPEWLAKDLPETVFEGGFMSRVVFVFKYWRDRNIAWPENPMPGEVEAIRKELLKIRATARGEVSIGASARDWFTEWYERTEGDIGEEESFSGFVERKPDTVLKLSLLLAVSEIRDIINLQDMKTALAIVNWTQEKMFGAFSKVDISKIGQVAMKIEEYLQQAGEATQREILRKFGHKLSQGVKTLNDIKILMIESGSIDVESRSTAKGAGGRPTIIWRYRDA